MNGEQNSPSGRDEHDRVASIVKDYQQVRSKYEAFAFQLGSLMRRLFEEGTDRLFTIEYRAKTVRSLTQKIEMDDRYNVLTSVPDLCGIRIVSYYNSAVATFTRRVESEFEVIESREHGQEAVEMFGYRSHHLHVRLTNPRAALPEWRPYVGLVAEIQVRSVLQHAWAIISHHLDYKSELDAPVSVRRKLFRVAALLETGDELFDGYRADILSMSSNDGSSTA